MNFIINRKYRTEKRIGRGAFGEIYLSTCLEDGHLVAAKIERLEIHRSQLFSEANVLERLKGAPGIPEVLYVNTEDGRNIMVMELLGPSLESLLGMCKQFSVKSAMMLGDQMLCRLQYIHCKGLIHRDIKPDNFLMGIGKASSVLYAIDFGLAKEYQDPKTHRHHRFKEGKKLTGTARYASVYTHMGYEQSRRDDIESVGYVLLYLMRGSLPWQGLPALNKDAKFRLIMQKKVELTPEVLCEGVPELMIEYFRYAKALHFEEKPDYAYLRRLMKQMLLQEGNVYDCIYDWMGNETYTIFMEKRVEMTRKQIAHKQSKDKKCVLF